MNWPTLGFREVRYGFGWQIFGELGTETLVNCLDQAEKKFSDMSLIKRPKGQRRNEMKLELESKVLVGNESKVWLADLTKQLDRLERLTKATGGKVAAPAEAEDEEETSDDDFAEKPVKTASKKASAGFDEDEDEIEAGEDDAPVAKKASKKAAASFDDEDEAEEAPAPAKKTKAKKVTIDEVNDACKARVTREITSRGVTGKEARTAVLALLKKKFKVSSVSELEPETYADVIAAMAGK